LPEYMAPATYVRLERMPLTANGKVDKRALPRPEIMERDLEDLFQVVRANELAEKQSPLKQAPFIRPRDIIELRLTQIWEELLNFRPISVMDGFFELGGLSLLAVGLVERIQVDFGISIPLQTLFQNDTIELLGVELRRQQENIKQTALVPIQTRGAKRPFFCVHPSGGTVLCYYYLSHFLGPEQPFYAFQSYGFDAGSKPINRVEDMASAYIKELRAIQPHGPYLIGGWSFGGVVAFEMAQQLLAGNDEVALLALFDTTLEVGPQIDDEEMSAVTEDLMIVKGGNVKQVISKARSREEFSEAFLEGIFLEGEGHHIHIPPSVRKLPAMDQVSYLIELGVKHKKLPPGFDLSRALRIAEIWHNNMYADSAYRPQPYAGKVSYFLAKESEIDDVKKTQKQFASEIECYEVPGTHRTLMEKKNAKGLAECLRHVLSNL